MCKLVGWTSSKNNPLAKAMADAALQAAHDQIRKTERDGFGYAQAGSTGLRARYLDPHEFHDMNGIPNLYRRAGRMAEAFATTYRTAHEGSYKPDRHMIGHGRTATCGINLENVHPFRRSGWTLAHNGVINWEGPKCKSHEKVTCDSQHLLIAMADNTPMLKRKEQLDHISGYAAFLALNPQGKLIVAVDDRAKLYAGITSKERWIFGTTPEIVEAVADAWNCSGVTAYPLAAWTWLEFAEGGKEPELSDWKHKQATTRQLGFASQSLGKGWDKSTHRKRKEYPASSAGAWQYSNYGSASNSSATWLSAHEAAEQRELMTEADAIAAVDASELGIGDYK